MEFLGGEKMKTQISSTTNEEENKKKNGGKYIFIKPGIKKIRNMKQNQMKFVSVKKNEWHAQSLFLGEMFGAK